MSLCHNNIIYIIHIYNIHIIYIIHNGKTYN